MTKKSGYKIINKRQIEIAAENPFQRRGGEKYVKI